MRVLFIFIFITLFTACSSRPLPEREPSEKVTVTGQQVKRSELPPGPKLTMSLNKKRKSSNIMAALAYMKALPQPKDIGDCVGLLDALNADELVFQIVDSSHLVLETEYAIYQYSFDDSSCPTH